MIWLLKTWNAVSGFRYVWNGACYAEFQKKSFIWDLSLMLKIEFKTWLTLLPKQVCQPLKALQPRLFLCLSERTAFDATNESITTRRPKMQILFDDTMMTSLQPPSTSSCTVCFRQLNIWTKQSASYIQIHWLQVAGGGYIVGKSSDHLYQNFCIWWQFKVYFFFFYWESNNRFPDTEQKNNFNNRIPLSLDVNSKLDSSAKNYRE